MAQLEAVLILWDTVCKWWAILPFLAKGKMVLYLDLLKQAMKSKRRPNLLKVIRGRQTQMMRTVLLVRSLLLSIFLYQDEAERILASEQNVHIVQQKPACHVVVQREQVDHPRLVYHQWVFE